ncbi:MAG: GMC oxidoreductase, partial [Gammaproteobacteria bacterium]|nr:GMC oxidoreductase [Gammaproteobacteria bacterium]
ESGAVPRLPGLMDNRQMLVPFVNLSMIGRRFSADSYQYHLLGVAIVSQDNADYVHGQITTLKTALLHPIIQKLPLDLRTATEITRALHSGLGLVNLNFHDTRREENYVTLDVSEPKLRPRLVIRYSPDSKEPSRVKTALRKLKRFLWKLGCIVPPGMAHVRPMGSSVHYAGVLPMSAEKKPLTTDSHGRSHDFENVFLVDGSTFPYLPAKNLTFTLMANATRIAREAF